MSTYAKKVEKLQIRATELKKKIPFTVKFHPDVKAGNKLQEECFSLMAEMAEKLDILNGDDHGEN